ncbi:uncharacterized protein SEPMUDRAFT_35932 [Sphaerulina musiva SO2202]|uniref:NTF2-like domain-containing protein n=1 Tax=Sphaerulina musiva (strain SO2202) TaxID=692275 RepID=N1QNV6_SPHMS|nr:uncharacterized protein SEPMUDRAFT_35932 [Sphaerulina musiva SO2202]EMF17684.1 hypothetical protein SEPMUDRAFT_35932 [Sphaerulina musiva SO2202]
MPSFTTLSTLATLLLLLLTATTTATPKTTRRQPAAAAVARPPFFKQKRPNWSPSSSSSGSNGGGRRSEDTTCMTSTDAQGVATNFKNLIAAYSETLANSSLTVDFVDYSDSVIELINNGCPDSVLGTATFDSRASFEAGQSAQPAIPFEQLNLWHNCNSVTIRWLSSGPGQEPSQVTGIIVMETVYSEVEGTWLISTVYSEFNSGAWLVNLGVFKPGNCTV